MISTTSLISEVKRSLNGGVLPADYYALAEQVAAQLGPDVLTLHSPRSRDNGNTNPATGRSPDQGGVAVLLDRPRIQPIAETEMDLYRHKKSRVVVRHVSDDRVVALVEIVSPGNKSTRHALDQFVQKAAEFLEGRIHLLIIDLFPPGKYDPQGIHSAIWDDIDGRDYTPPPGKPLTLAAYEADMMIRAYVEPVAVGDVLPDMPLFLEPEGCVEVPLESCYRGAWEAVPRRWKTVLEPPR